MALMCLEAPAADWAGFAHSAASHDATQVPIHTSEDWIAPTDLFADLQEQREVKLRSAHMQCYVVAHAVGSLFSATGHISRPAFAVTLICLKPGG